MISATLAHSARSDYLVVWKCRTNRKLKNKEKKKGEKKESYFLAENVKISLHLKISIIISIYTVCYQSSTSEIFFNDTQTSQYKQFI